MISYESSGSFNNIDSFLSKMLKGDIFGRLESMGQRGVTALASATPIGSSLTAASWKYRVERTPRSTTITWYNTNVVDGRPIAVLLQYGHGTGTGGYVQGRDYINPAIKPVFDQIANEVWKAVTNA